MRDYGTSDDVDGVLRVYATDADRIGFKNGDEIVIVQGQKETSRRVVNLRPEQTGGTVAIEYGEKFAP